ncbi:hypothetical protein BOTCAL_0466g00080 [Botryotinia calthae]|uniref:Uncharacterized protein n=1 Tax=Botryotinia calthae TaxID=38488 RepID=A0A4Y8CMK6_9HELO|nr:hypothetical protein BOTCAL_0466g00080 [Botryotinia calthae]
MSKYIDVLNNWLNRSSAGSHSFTVPEAMRDTQEAFSDRLLFSHEPFKKEKQIYVKCGVLRPPENILLSREPRLSGLFETPSKSTELRKYIEKNWRFNPTMMDPDWYDDLQRIHPSEEFDWSKDPFHAVFQFEAFHRGRNPSSLFDHVAPLFQDAADSLKKLKGRFHVEVLCGDVVEIFEWLRFGTSPTRIPRSEKLLTEFDAIHLSNIPSAQPVSEDDWSALLPRKEFLKWFYVLFFRIALPYNVDIFEPNTVVFSPLNLTILFRLMDQLRSRHYPSHWMSEIVSNIIENKVVSNFRSSHNDANIRVGIGTAAPDQKPLHRSVLPRDGNSHTNIHAPSSFQYNFPFTSVSSHQEFPDTLTLIFWSHRYFMDSGEMSPWSFNNEIRPLLDPIWGDEIDSRFKGSKLDTFREKGLIVWSTLEWDVGAKKASAWVPSTLVNRMIREGDWACGLFRIDIWQSCLQQSLTMKYARKGEVWEDNISPAADQ